MKKLTRRDFIGFPPMDKLGRPKMFYSKLVHDECHRYPDYERENFAKDSAFPFYTKNRTQDKKEGV